VSEIKWTCANWNCQNVVPNPDVAGPGLGSCAKCGGTIWTSWVQVPVGGAPHEPLTTEPVARGRAGGDK
jgi:hypothetical protein